MIVEQHPFRSRPARILRRASPTTKPTCTATQNVRVDASRHRVSPGRIVGRDARRIGNGHDRGVGHDRGEFAARTRDRAPTMRRAEARPMHARARMRVLALLFVGGSVLGAACTSTRIEGSGGAAGMGSSGACALDADCGRGQLCGFAESSGCSARGECSSAPGLVCEAYSPGCACDGTVINMICTGLPAGYARKPQSHAGTCNGECVAGYVCLSTVSCATDADCAALGSRCDACAWLCGCGGLDGGACCPSSWSMYACTYPDGGAGLACANPAQRCASSTTCGAGCDAVVGGRCDGG